jgi:hypothetical protein
MVDSLRLLKLPLVPAPTRHPAPESAGIGTGIGTGIGIDS